MSYFDEQPDGDPHGECAAEIVTLRSQVETLTKARAGLLNTLSMHDRLFDDCDQKLAAAQARIAQLREALSRCKGVFENCTIESGVCGCGTEMRNHPLSDHDGSDYGAYIAGRLFEETCNVLAVPDDLSALAMHDVELIERCAALCARRAASVPIGVAAANQCAKDILALKP